MCCWGHHHDQRILNMAQQSYHFPLIYTKPVFQILRILILPSTLPRNRGPLTWLFNEKWGIFLPDSFCFAPFSLSSLLPLDHSSSYERGISYLQWEYRREIRGESKINLWRILGFNGWVEENEASNQGTNFALKTRQLRFMCVCIYIHAHIHILIFIQETGFEGKYNSSVFQQY